MGGMSRLPWRKGILSAFWVRTICQVSVQSLSLPREPSRLQGSMAILAPRRPSPCEGSIKTAFAIAEGTQGVIPLHPSFRDSKVPSKCPKIHITHEPATVLL